MERSVIFITGAASGIGKATAKLFSEKGWFVGATDINQGDLLSLEQELPGDCFTAQLDVTNKSQFDEVMARFSEAVNGRLDLLFNNAGIAEFGFLEDLPHEKVMATINVNLVGVLNGVTAAMPLLKTTPNSLCFTTASSAANFGTPGLAVYGATKSREATPNHSAWNSRVTAREQLTCPLVSSIHRFGTQLAMSKTAPRRRAIWLRPTSTEPMLREPSNPKRSPSVYGMHTLATRCIGTYRLKSRNAIARRQLHPSGFETK